MILALVRAFDDRAIENAHRINELDSVFSAVSRILSSIPLERHTLQYRRIVWTRWAGTAGAGTTTATGAGVGATTATGAGVGKALGVGAAAKTAAAAKLAAIGGAAGGGAFLGFVLVTLAVAGIGYLGYKAIRTVGDMDKPVKA